MSQSVAILVVKMLYYIQQEREDYYESKKEIDCEDQI